MRWGRVRPTVRHVMGGKKIHVSHIYIVISFVEKNGIENNLEKFIYCTLNSTHCCKANFVKKTHSVWICMSSELGHNTLPFSLSFLFQWREMRKWAQNSRSTRVFFLIFISLFFLSLIWTENLKWYHFILPLFFRRIKKSSLQNLVNLFIY